MGKNLESMDEKDKALFDRIAKKYSLRDDVKSCVISRAFMFNQAFRPIIESDSNDYTIMDIACGIGAPAEYLRGKYTNYYGIDHSSEMIMLAKQRYKSFDNVHFVNANIKDRIDLNELADLVLALGALHHMTDYNDVFSALKKNVKHGALFIAVEPNDGNIVIRLLRNIRALVDKGYSPDQVYFKKNELIKILEDNGLVDVKVFYHGYFSPPFGHFPLKSQFAVMFSQISVWLDRFVENYLNWLFGFLSWRMIVLAKFPGS